MPLLAKWKYGMGRRLRTRAWSRWSLPLLDSLVDNAVVGLGGATVLKGGRRLRGEIAVCAWLSYFCWMVKGEVITGCPSVGLWSPLPAKTPILA